MDRTERREALADFLKSRRARLTPIEVGLPNGRRRRAPGLRREEVSELAEIGVSWYTALEQARDVRPSEEVLARIAVALRLSPVEREHLALLGRPLDGAAGELSEEVLRPGLERVVAALDPHPAYVIGRRWDLLTWNRSANLVFGLDIPQPPHPRNMIWRLLTKPSNREYPDWDEYCRHVVGQFRADAARYPGDRRIAALVADLQEAVPEFSGWWSRHEVNEQYDGEKQLMHATLGELRFDHVTMAAPSDSDQKLRIYAGDQETAAKIAVALASGTPLS